MARRLETLSRLCHFSKVMRSIRCKRPGMLCDGDILLHDNARSHTALKTQAAKVQVGSLEYPYSQDLAPSAYFLFPKLKEHLSGTRFSLDSNV
ncbi:hypothetical protein AVEN_100867-1 [Araneus ventricosus]|uniref:Mariner Mos1 transposase n=1 Tax=Araneus ventricosus TaxID=182803 RepID=A0A4Y2AVC2_ARAVE|nr:hypothetical protein AVEN_100867-1 [Araneus ventricosus]